MYPSATKFLNEYCIEHELDVNNLHLSDIIECMECFADECCAITRKNVRKQTQKERL